MLLDFRIHSARSRGVGRQSRDKKARKTTNLGDRECFVAPRNEGGKGARDQPKNQVGVLFPIPSPFLYFLFSFHPSLKKKKRNSAPRNFLWLTWEQTHSRTLPSRHTNPRFERILYPSQPHGHLLPPTLLGALALFCHFERREQGRNKRKTTSTKRAMSWPRLRFAY